MLSMSVVPTNIKNKSTRPDVPQLWELKAEEAIAQPRGEMEATALPHTGEEIVLEDITTITGEDQCKDNFAKCSYLSI